MPHTIAHVSDQLRWEALDDETRRLARVALDVEIDEINLLRDRVVGLEQAHEARDNADMAHVSEIERIETALDSMSLLFNGALSDMRTMLRGLKARIKP